VPQHATIYRVHTDTHVVRVLVLATREVLASAQLSDAVDRGHYGRIQRVEIDSVIADGQTLVLDVEVRP